MNQSLNASVLTQATAAFTSLLGPPLDLWVFEAEHWHHAVDVIQNQLPADLLEAALILPESLPCLPAAILEPVVEEVSRGLFRIDLPVVLPGEYPTQLGVTVWLAGTLRTTTQGLVVSLLRLGSERWRLEQEVAEQRLGMAPHLAQISHNCEELAWLRRLSERVDIGNTSDPLVELAQGILPDLQSLVLADGMVLVSSHSGSNNADRTKVRSVGCPLLWSGQRLLEDQGCISLVELLRTEAQQGRPLVINRRELRAGVELPPSIHSCIQIALTHHETCYGWLLAFNRNVEQSMLGDRPSQYQMLGYQAFGTNEASLMTSAAATLAAHAYSAEQFREKETMLIGVIRAMISAIDAKDVYTCGHSDRVALSARCIAQQLGLEPIECERVYMSGLLHDVGKIGIPDSVLLKQGKLTDEESRVIQQHPSIGYAILKHMPQLRHVLPGVLHHHEAVDGSGYPHGLKGNAIPVLGRILAVADTFDALTTDRPYRSGMPLAKAVAVLKEGVGKQWDARVVKAFLKALPAVEVATRDSTRRVKKMLRKMGDSGLNLQASEPDAISKAVAMVHS